MTPLNSPLRPSSRSQSKGLACKPYPAYKPSGVEWLGDVPMHWEVKRLKMAAQLTDKKVEADEDNPLPYIGLENIESWTGRLLPINPDVVPTGTANAFKAGHTLFGKLRPYLAKACNPDFDGLCSTELLVLKGVEFDRDLLRYALLSDGFIKLVDSSTYGSKMPRASWDFIGNCVLPVAPPAEQRAIADFLDRETGKIDRLVAKKRELIETLKEERAALISRTVTRGLNPDLSAVASAKEDAKLKPSGVEWLGDVPVGWEVKRLKHMLSQPLQYGANESADLDDPDLPRYVRITDVHEDGSLRDDTFRSLPVEVAKPYLLEDGDLLFARSGATSGKTFLYRKAWGNCAYAGYLIRARFNQRMAVPAFVKYFTVSVSYWQWLSSIYIQSTIQNVSAEKYAELMVPVPPLSEQRAIADFLDRETSKIDRLAEKVEKAIARLQEYRAALITAAVTGKIDVREEAAARHTDKHGRARTGTKAPLVYPAQETELRMVAEGNEPYDGR